MGARIGQLVAVCVLTCTGCAGGIGELSDPAEPAPHTSTPTLEAPSASTPPAPYGEPSDELRALATRFAVASLGYHAWAEEQRDFLARVEDLATDAEIRRLRRSGRAHLRWWMLRQRLEHVTIHVTGVSDATTTDGRITLEVRALRVTRSTVSTVRDFVGVSLDMVQTPDGWRVDRAEGGGL